MKLLHSLIWGTLVGAAWCSLHVSAQTAYITYHNYYAGQSTNTISCSDGANGLQQQFGYYTIDPMFPYVSATSNIAWNSPNCGTCYELQASGNTVYVTAIDQCGAGPSGEMHFDMAPAAFEELLGSAGVAAGSGYATYRAVDGSNCVGNSGGSGSTPSGPNPSPTPSPTDSSGSASSSDPVSSVTPPPQCLSAHVVVEVKGNGPTLLKDVSVGDFVADGNGGFERVYAFAHLDLNASAEFLEIHTTPAAAGTIQAFGDGSPLEITHEHLLLTETSDGKLHYVPAQMVRVGDVLGGGGGERLRVTKVSTIERTGLFAPLTTSGTLAANGVAISCYVSLQGAGTGSFKFAGGKETMVSHHSVAHWLLSPVRLLCATLPSTCVGSTFPSGYPWFVRAGFRLIGWFDYQNIVIQVLLFTVAICCCGVSMLFEMALFSRWGWLVLLFLGASGFTKNRCPKPRCSS